MKRRMLALLLITALLLSMMTVTASACHPAMTIDKSIASGPGPYKLGDTVTYSVTITNTGTEDLKNVTVTDALDTSSPRNVGDLRTGYWDGPIWNRHWHPSESVTYTYNHTVTETERDARILNNTASATAKYRDDGWKTLGPITDKTSAVILDPEITLAKTADVPEGFVGEPVPFTLAIQNTGNVDLSVTSLTDTLAGDLTALMPASIAAGGSVNIPYSITPSAIGAMVNTATLVVTGADQTLTATDTETVPIHSLLLDVDKTADPVTAMVGDPILYTVIVTNNSDVTLSGLLVTDSLAGTLVSDASLSPGGAMTVTYGGIATFGDYMEGVKHNLVTATGHYNQKTVTANDMADVTIIKTGDFTVDKWVDDGDEPVPGAGFAFRLDIHEPEPTETPKSGPERITADAFDWALFATGTTQANGQLVFDDMPLMRWYRLMETGPAGYTNDLGAEGFIFFLGVDGLIMPYMEASGSTTLFDQRGDDPVKTVTNVPIPTPTPSPSPSPTPPPTVNVNLTVIVEGPGTALPGSGAYGLNSVVQMTVTPGDGAAFIGWFGANGAEVVDNRITMNADKTIIARFEVPTPIEPAPVPEAAPPVTEEPVIAPEPIPEAAPIEMPLEEEIPQAAPMLPKTGGIPLLLLALVGSGLAGAGAWMRKRNR